jgi:Fe-S cluster assembly iron-binding protein IscA
MTITEAAARHLAAVLENANAGQETTVRLAPGDRGWVMQLDQPDPSDRAFDHDGRTVLVVAAEADAALSGVMLDVRETEQGAQLLLTGAPAES